MNQKIVYIAGIDWNWIKQRPQIIAEELSKNNKVYVLFPHSYKRKNLTKNIHIKNKNLKLIERFKIPFSGTYFFLHKFDTVFHRLLICLMTIVISPHVLYLSNPDDYCFWLGLYRGIILYDCMDDYFELASGEKIKKSIQRKEKKLLQVSDFVLCSSSYLAEMVKKKYKVDPYKVSIVRNGYSGGIKQVQEMRSKNTGTGLLKIGYIGTVSSWFDFEILSSVISIKPNIEIHIWGPISGTPQIVNNSHLIFEGVIQHDQLFNVTRKCDALIMPFKINNIVRAVDPVKLYEYINFNKPIISVYYDEIKRFEPFVWFYSNLTDLLECIKKVEVIGLKYSECERKNFLEQNSWERRVNEIEKIIKADKN